MTASCESCSNSLPFLHSLIPHYIMSPHSHSQSTPPALSSLSLTHVLYPPNDPTSEFLAYITLTPISLIIVYVTVIISRREVACIWMFAGQLLNEVVNFILKRVIKEKRPHDHLGKGYGMPSSHSQYMTYFTVFLILYLSYRIKLNSIYKLGISAVAVVTCLLVMYSRIHLQYHTPLQVLAGASLGCVFGLFWYMIGEYVARPLSLEHWRILEFKICQVFCLRDSRVVDNVVGWEYAQWKKEYERERSKVGKSKKSR
ncbi:dolichyl pyrophosphate phosphatase 1 [Paraphysoderma sedebokerense]|nr:dolichyl pyrophosphate phosphatase 1 [Paraphysoderma sedebokerense]